MDQESGYHVAIPSSPDPSFSMAHLGDDTLQDFFSRPLKIAAFTWNQSINFFEEFNPWTLFFTNPRNINRITNYNLLRCKLCVKILINGNGFHYGRLLVSYNPLDAYQTFVRNRALIPQDSIAASQRLSIVLDPTTSMGGTMELPFIYPWNAMSIPDQDWVNMGLMSIRTLNPLKHANGATDSVQISVFAWAEDVELAVPTSVEPGSIAPQAGLYTPQSADEYQTESKSDPPLSSTLAAVSSAAGAVASISAVAPYAKPLEMAAGAGAKIAKAMGFSRPRELASDKPLRPSYFGSMATTTGEDSSLPLSMDQKQALNVDSRTCGLDGTDEMQISHICARESYLTKFDWPVASPTETLLWNCRVAPTLFDINGDPREYHTVPMCYVSDAFRYWKGTIQFRFQIVASSFHKGRLKIVWDPVAFATNEYNTNYTQVVDIAHSRDFTVDVGWGSLYPYLKCDSIMDKNVPNFSTGTLSASFSGEFNGVLAVYVVNDLTVPDSSVNNDIQVNVFVKSEDMEFRLPNFSMAQNETFTPFEPQSGLYKPQSGRYVPQSGSPDIAGTPAENRPEDVPVETLAQTQLSTSEDTFFGDPIVSIRQLLKRYTSHLYYHVPASGFQITQLDLPAFPVCPGYVNNGTAIHQSSATQAYNYVEMNYISWFAPLFLGWRGSVRHKYHIANLATSRPGYAKATLNILWTDSKSTTVGTPLLQTSLGVGTPNVNRNLLISCQCGTPGTQATDYGHNPVLQVEVPYLLNQRFSFPRSASRNGEPGVMIDFFQHNSDIVVTDYTAAGEDFMLVCFISTPILYSYEHPVYV